MQPATIGTIAVQARPSAGGGVPPNMLSGLTFWVDGTDASTLLNASAGSAVSTDGTQVGMALSKAGNHCLYQAMAGLKPLYKTGIVNGKSVLRFDGTNDVMSTFARSASTVGAAAAASAFLTSTQKLFIFGLSMGPGSAISSNIYDVAALVADAGGYLGVHADNGGGGPSNTVHIYNYPGFVQSVSAVAAQSTFLVITARHQAGGISLRVNGGAWSAVVASGATTDLTNALQVAKSGTGANYVGMDLAHLAIYNTSQTDAQILSVERWIAAEMGLII